jgi:arylsulfatase A-like enzyme
LGEKLHWRKFALWEEATHSVLLWIAPGVTRPGTVCDEPVNLIDIYPTLIELCGLKTKPELDGTSLVPQLRDPAVERGFPTLTTHGRGNHGLRSTRWRYIQYADGSEELYDRRKDPLEWTNLAQDPTYAQVKGEMAKHVPKEAAPEQPRRK